MTLATIQSGSARDLAITGQNAAFARLAEWAESAQAAYQVAQRLVDTAFVPQQYRGKPAEATAAILAGSEVGLSPMSSLRAFDNIQGTAAPKAITLRAVVQSFGHEMVLVESTETRCVMKGRRRGSDDWQTVRWTIDRAKNLGLTGKDNWKKQPGAMLTARATSELARLIASDAILGIGYSSEELSDGGAVDVVTGEVVPEPTPLNTRRMGRPKKDKDETPDVAPADDPAPEPEPADNDTDAPDEAGITDPQMKLLQAAYKDVPREQRLQEAADVLGRSVESFSELSKADASKVIDWLAGPDKDGA